MVRVEGELAEHVELRDESVVQRAVQRADAAGARSRVRERHAVAAQIARRSAKRTRVDGRSLHDGRTGSSCARTSSTQSTPWCRWGTPERPRRRHAPLADRSLGRSAWRRRRCTRRCRRASTRALHRQSFHSGHRRASRRGPQRAHACWSTLRGTRGRPRRWACASAGGRPRGEGGYDWSIARGPKLRAAARARWRSLSAETDGASEPPIMPPQLHTRRDDAHKYPTHRLPCRSSHVWTPRVPASGGACFGPPSCDWYRNVCTPAAPTTTTSLGNRAAPATRKTAWATPIIGLAADRCSRSIRHSTVQARTHALGADHRRAAACTRRPRRRRCIRDDAERDARPRNAHQLWQHAGNGRKRNRRTRKRGRLAQADVGRLGRRSRAASFAQNGRNRQRCFVVADTLLLTHGCTLTDNANKGTDNANKGTDNANKGTDNVNKGTDNVNRGYMLRTAARSLIMPIRVNKGTDNANKGTDNANKG
jgi:hypothetical protein